MKIRLISGLAKILQLIFGGNYNYGGYS